MPKRALRPCGKYGCGILTRQRFCINHRKERRDKQRLYDTAKWKQLRQAVLEDEPRCVHCLERGIVEPATEVDHIKPHDTGPSFWLRDNLQGLCHRCHSRKTVVSDGGYGDGGFC